MIVGIATLFAMLFGGGSLDYYYIDKIEEGVKKEIVDKDRKKELQAELKAYTKVVKEFYKVRNKDFKVLKTKNLERGINEDYYLDFFDKRMQERVKLQETTLESRLALQEKITDDEWDAIMKKASSAETKEEEKAQRKKAKKDDKNAFREQETAIVQNVADQDRRANLLEGLAIYEATYNQIHESYESINVNESEALIDKNLSREKIIAIGEQLNEQRITLYKGFSVFIITAKANSTEEDYKAIMKAFNKLIK
ncbi:MAG: hypothetical protein ABJJ25_17145 [Eudoraea sp.]|uniref:hypothetical protein n=1 Tax=Eudoraea sp. TaxID=1979955 RepID=UPI0032654F90